uniref:Uncharacterized protein n=2 Tax=Parascaris univalens TaxID=6257 RepID=A0A915ASU2_PARUN
VTHCQLQSLPIQSNVRNRLSTTIEASRSQVAACFFPYFSLEAHMFGMTLESQPRKFISDLTVTVLPLRRSKSLFFAPCAFDSHESFGPQPVRVGLPDRFLFDRDALYPHVCSSRAVVHL